MLQFAQFDMAKFLLIKPANYLLGKNFNLRADIHIKASISAHVPWNIKGNISVINWQAETNWPTSQKFLTILGEDQSQMKVTYKVHKD